jgi:murein DD-endopeptidase MepM/ murein hydrolase activator NlpD
MRRLFIVIAFAGFVLLTVNTVNSINSSNIQSPITLKAASDATDLYHELIGTIKEGQTFFDIFRHYGIDMSDLAHLQKASDDIYPLRNVYPGNQYKIRVDPADRVRSLVYMINDDTTLRITRTDTGFLAEKISVQYEREIHYVGGAIRDNLVNAIGAGKDNTLLALNLSDIFAWDIDFSTDLRKGDEFRIIVEGLYKDGQFRKYGDILSATFKNNGKDYAAYKFEHDMEADYYDPAGNSLRKAFLKAPLNFRRISSSFTSRRLHPILKIYRPHHGIDYSAPKGTPVSVVGDGTVTFSGYKGQYGKLVIVRHPNGYRTYYGHLSRIKKNARRGSKVKQGDIIGSVGSTGLATGPHLHFEMRRNNKPVNPRTIKMPRGKPVPRRLMGAFQNVKSEMDSHLAMIRLPVYALAQ